MNVNFSIEQGSTSTSGEEEEEEREGEEKQRKRMRIKTSRVTKLAYRLNITQTHKG